MKMVRALAVIAVLLALWLAGIYVGGAEHFILPRPWDVAEVFYQQYDLLAEHAVPTLIEIVLGLLLGAMLGVGCALAMAYHQPTRAWLQPALIASQAVPVFAIAPLLVLWLGYGLASKIAMATLVIFFPITVALYDGLRRIEPGWLDLAQAMGASRGAILRQIRLPAALPALATGLRLAAAVAPIAAIIGEWVGASAGLGYLMMQALARANTELGFAALLALIALAVALYALVNLATHRLLPWHRENLDAPFTPDERIAP